MLLSIRKTRQAGASLVEAEAPSARAVDMLLACHGRLRSYAALAERVAAAPAVPPAEIAEAARSLPRYHHIALPLHEADEDRSVRAALVAAGAPAAALDALAAMEDEHRRIDAIVAELLPAWDAIALDPALLPAQAFGLAAPTSALAALWASHLAREEADIFPALADLPPDIERELAREIRARRAPVPGGGAGPAPDATKPR